MAGSVLGRSGPLGDTEAIALVTGGSAFADTDRRRRCDGGRRSEAYYLLGYQPDRPAQAGERKVKVTVARDGVTSARAADTTFRAVRSPKGAPRRPRRRD